MAAREREQGIRHPDSPRPAVVDSLRGIPSLYEALRPGYITDAVAPLTQPGILWKLDHSVRVSLSMLDIHAYLGSPSEHRVADARAGLVHDALGAATTMIHTPNVQRIVTGQEKIAILNKPGLLTAEEWEIMAAHPADAHEYLLRYNETRAGLQSLHHHSFQGERSYPFRTPPALFKDRQLLRDLALFAAMDTTDALLTPRPYPKWDVVEGERVLFEASTSDAWSAERVQEELIKKFGSILQPEVIRRIVQIGQTHAGRTSADYTKPT